MGYPAGEEAEEGAGSASSCSMCSFAASSVAPVPSPFDSGVRPFE